MTAPSIAPSSDDPYAHLGVVESPDPYAHLGAPSAPTPRSASATPGATKAPQLVAAKEVPSDKAAVKSHEKSEKTGHGQETTEHKFSSTQFDLPPEIADAVTAMAAAIPDEELAEDGREDHPHITLKFGLVVDGPDLVQAALAGEPPITVRLGRTSIFPNGESNAGDVVKIDVDSAELRRLNDKISSAVPHVDTHPRYQPHATLACVLPGLGVNYEGDASLDGQEITLDCVTFSGRDGTAIEIPLEGGDPVSNDRSEAGESL